MNCKTFHHFVFEYLDDTLDRAIKAKAEVHLQGCASCRGALDREQAAGRSLRAALQRSTASLSLNPGLHDRVQRAIAPKEKRPTWCGGWLRLLNLSLQPARVACGLLLFISLGFAFQHWSDQARQKSVASRSDIITWNVQMPLPSENPTVVVVDTPSIQVFRLREDNVETAPSFAFVTFSESRP